MVSSKFGIRGLFVICAIAIVYNLCWTKDNRNLLGLLFFSMSHLHLAAWKRYICNAVYDVLYIGHLVSTH